MNPGERLCRLLHAPKPSKCDFYLHITASLNFIIKDCCTRRPCFGQRHGTQRHDAPLGADGKIGVSLDRILRWSRGGCFWTKVEGDPANTWGHLMLHASNVVGTVMPSGKLGLSVYKHGASLWWWMPELGSFPH